MQQINRVNLQKTKNLTNSSLTLYLCIGMYMKLLYLIYTQSQDCKKKMLQ